MRKLIYLIIVISLFGCNTRKNTGIVLKKGKAIIEGKVYNFNDNNRVLRLASEGVVKDIEQTAILDSLGNFRFVIQVFYPQDVSLVFENNNATLYIEPGDSLFIELDANAFEKDRSPNYKITGMNSSTSKNIRDFYQFHNPFSYVPQYNKSPKEFLTDLRNQINHEDSILNEFSMKKNPTKEFIYWAKNNIRYTFANYIMGYLTYGRNKKIYKQNKTEMFNTNMFPVDKDSAIVCDLYIVHLYNYIVFKYLYSDSIFNELQKRKEFLNAYSRVFNNIVKNEKPGLSRDFMIYKILHNLYDYRSPDISLDSVAAIWKSYKKYINNPVLIKTFNEDVVNSEKQINEKDSSINSNLVLKYKSVDKFFETLHSKYKNKIIYIDIWATWCGPCRAEIPYSIGLQNYFKNKPIAFVNLCFESDKNEWEKIIANKNIKGDNYFLSSDESKLFRGELKFAGFPTYMIMDRKGKLINKNAPRPSDRNNIENILNKLIKNSI